MNDEPKSQEFHPRENKSPERSSAGRTDAESGSQRKGNRRPGGGRKGAYHFDDQMERAICQLVTHTAPQAFPAISRSGLATNPPVEVARSETVILFCDGVHDGPHLWPNGDQVS